MPLYVLIWPRSLLNMPFLGIKSLFCHLYAWNGFAIYCIFVAYALKCIFYPLYTLSWPRSLLYLPCICIKALLGYLYAFKFTGSSIEFFLYAHQSPFCLCLWLVMFSIAFTCICIEAFLCPLYALNWPHFL